MANVTILNNPLVRARVYADRAEAAAVTIHSGGTGILPTGDVEFFRNRAAAFTWTEGHANAETAAPSGGTCTITVFVDGVAEATLTIADGATAATASGFPVSVARDAVVRIAAANPGAAEGVTYSLIGKQS